MNIKLNELSLLFLYLLSLSQPDSTLPRRHTKLHIL